MRVNFKKRALILLAGATVLTLGSACLCMKLPAANAAEGSTYCAFYNVGANDDATAVDAALGLAETGVTVSNAGTVTEGGTLFESYAVNASYSVALSGAESYRVAVAVKSGATVKIGGETVALPADAGENVVVSKTMTSSPVTVEVTGKVCAILADDAAGAATLMAVDYTDGQVISYGALLEDVLDNATGYYSDGTASEVKIEYGDINGGTGVNVNFTTVDVEGTIAGTELSVTRHITTMPDDLVYFINCGSNIADGKYPDTADPYYAYNQMVFDYYGNGLKNYGMPDQKTTQGSNTWGYYTAATYTAPGDATFPYNSLIWTDEATDMGYMLTGLDAGNYRVWIGTLSHWHARTVTITFNGKVVGSDNLRINASKGYTIYENVTPDANGKIDLHMQGASTNEPCINFIAVQKMETEVAAVPDALQGGPTIDTEDTSLTVQGAVAGAKLQIYNASKPNQVIYEERYDPEHLTADGYVLSWGEKLENISQLNVVQITNGGSSAPLLISITDIKLVGDNTKIAWIVDADKYTTDKVTIKVQAEAGSGIASWSYRLGEYGEEIVNKLDRPFRMSDSFTATQNGDYYVVVTSGLGVTYLEIVKVNNIDPDSPVIVITPSTQGWKEGSYNLDLAVTSIAPVVEYKLFKNGQQVGTTATEAPASLEFTQKGEYVIYVKTAAGRTATSAFLVSDEATVTKVSSVYASRTLTFTFGATDDYEVASVEAYRLTDSSAERMTISSGNKMDVYYAGTYVVTVTTTTGAVEVFSFKVTQSDLSRPVTKKSGGSSAQLGIGIGVGVGGIAIAAVAITLGFIFLRKKGEAQSENTETDDKS